MKNTLEIATMPAAQIAAALGPNWKHEEANGGHAHLVRNDGLKFWISAASRHSDKKHHVSLSLPHNCPSLYDNNGDKVTAGSIGVSPDKAPEKIAADITRRLLPQAETVYALAIKRMELDKRADAARVAAFEAVAKASGGRAKYEWNGNAPDPTRPKFTVSVGGDSHLWEKHGYGEMKINSEFEPTVGIKLESVPLKVALQISEFLRDNVYKLSA